MGKYLMLVGVCIELLYSICNRFVWKIPNKIAIPVLVIAVAMILVGAVWGRPFKEAAITLCICAVIAAIGVFLTAKFMK